MKEIASAFVKAKKAFRPALKEKANPAFKGTKYADLSSCIEAVDDAFLANGIVMYQESFEDCAGVTVETVLLHESGEIIRSGKLHVPASKQDPQGYGSALTYARRYSLMAACGIAPEDDDGNAASKPKQTKRAESEATAGMSEDDIEAHQMAMHKAKTFDELKAVFGAAYKQAKVMRDEAAAVALTTFYDARKATIAVPA
jgi:hypothetical protein